MPFGGNFYNSLNNLFFIIRMATVLRVTKGLQESVVCESMMESKCVIETLKPI